MLTQKSTMKLRYINFLVQTSVQTVIDSSLNDCGGYACVRTCTGTQHKPRNGFCQVPCNCTIKGIIQWIFPFGSSASLSQSFMLITKSRLRILSLINHHNVSSLNRGSHPLNPAYQVQLSIDKLVKNKEVEQIEISPLKWTCHLGEKHFREVSILGRRENVMQENFNINRILYDLKKERLLRLPWKRLSMRKRLHKHNPTHKTDKYVDF